MSARPYCCGRDVMGILWKSLTLRSAATLTEASRSVLLDEMTLVHSTSLFNSSMSRFSLARLFWNHVITCWRQGEVGTDETFWRENGMALG